MVVVVKVPVPSVVEMPVDVETTAVMGLGVVVIELVWDAEG